MLTLEEFLANPEHIKTAKYGTVFTLRCSRLACAQQVGVPRHEVLDRLRSGSLLTYCSTVCRGLHLRDRETVVKGGVPGRICVDCGAWTPMEKMTRGRICRACKAAQPEQKFAVVRAQARYRGDHWALTFEEFMRFWQMSCHYCGETPTGVRLDRVDPTQGYEVSNVVSCCWACNRGKGAGTLVG